MISNELIAMREEERRRVSTVLHHDVGSLAVGMSAHFDAIEEDIRSGKTQEALKWMKRTRKLFDQSVTRLKQVAVELRPPELDLLGLSAALRHHFAQTTRRGGIRIHFTQTLGRKRVPSDMATVVFRIVQEALTNAIRHGHARKVGVRLSVSKKRLSLLVRNDGKSFPLAGRDRRSPPHLGLHMMQEMAASVGGILKVDSMPAKGATLRVSLPLPSFVSCFRTISPIRKKDERLAEEDQEETRRSHNRLHVQARQGVHHHNPVEIRRPQAEPFRGTGEAAVRTRASLRLRRVRQTTRD